MGIVDTLKQYIIGVPEKAMLYIPNPAAIQRFEQVFGPGGFADGIGTMQKQQEDTIRKLGKQKLKIGETTAARSRANDIAGGAQDLAGFSNADNSVSIYNTLTVQYNPKTLVLRGLGGATRTHSSGLGQGAENSISMVDNATSTTLGCELVFTNVNISDAFMTEDLYNLNMEAVAGFAANRIKNALGKAPTVQPQVDGMLSLLMNSHTRRIIFAWAGMVFRGELVRVDASYKMFNKKGDPIIATINIEIRQGFEDNDNTSEKHWRESFNKAFKEHTNGGYAFRE